MSARDDSDSGSDDSERQEATERLSFTVDTTGSSSGGRERKSHRPRKGQGVTPPAPFWPQCPPAPFPSGGNPMFFPFNAHIAGSHSWSYPPAPHALPGGSLAMPPWYHYYGSTVNADQMAVPNQPMSAVSGPLTGPALSGPLTGPAISSSPSGHTSRERLTSQASKLQACSIVVPAIIILCKR